MSNTPKGERVNICFIGKTNVGKSTIVNALIGHDVSIVSEIKGTTTDPVIKRFELIPIGAVTIFDTAGYDDHSPLGEKRLNATMKALFRADIAVIVVDERGIDDTDMVYIVKLSTMKIPYIIVWNKVDIAPINTDSALFFKQRGINIVPMSKTQHQDTIIALHSALFTLYSTLNPPPSTLLKDLITENDKIVLVMPIDDSAPKGRIILPQVQVLREILDVNAIALGCTPQSLPETIQALKEPPKLVITDSQAIDTVHSTLHAQPSSLHTQLTTFSILFARYRGELKPFLDGLKALDDITATDQLLIAEACSHNTMHDDIGLHKIPNLLEKRLGFKPQIKKVNGHDFPDDLEKYKLVIHCGACMMTRTELMRRIHECQRRGVPITNYGLLISELHNTLEKVIEIFKEELK